MAEMQSFGKSNTKVKCYDKNKEENVKTVEIHKGESGWQRLKISNAV